MNIDGIDLRILESCHGGIDREGLETLSRTQEDNPYAYLQMRIGCETGSPGPWNRINPEDYEGDSRIGSRTIHLFYDLLHPLN